jgi:hypothetical protein
VRIAMTIGVAGESTGRLVEVVEEIETGEGAAKVTLVERTGKLHADLTSGADVASLIPLAANAGLACPGVQLSGQGFVVAPDDVSRFSDATRERMLRRYVTGRDMTQVMREQYVLDTYGLTLDALRDQYPDAFQWLHDRVRPERETKRGETKDSQEYADNWWLFAKTRSKFRHALTGLRRIVVTSRTARHRTFQFLDASFLPETKVLIFGFDDAFHLGVLSSRIHVLFANRVGGWLGVGNDPVYVKTRCLEKFPFPDASEAQRARIRDIAERLDAHRKRQQHEHPQLTLTDMYNVLEKLRSVGGHRAVDAPAEGTDGAVPSNPALTAKERVIHEHGLVTVLRELHDQLDAAVAEAYALAPGASDDTILTHLCALNAQRAVEERTGTIRWLRPAFQNPTSTATQTTLATGTAESTPALAQPAAKLAWPKTLAEQAQAVRAALTSLAAPADAALVAAQFKGARADRVADLLETLASLGQARTLPGGKYVAA